MKGVIVLLLWAMAMLCSTPAPYNLYHQDVNTRCYFHLMILFFFQNIQNKIRALSKILLLATMRGQDVKNFSWLILFVTLLGHKGECVFLIGY